jgi:hypothetical protein
MIYLFIDPIGVIVTLKTKEQTHALLDYLDENLPPDCLLASDCWCDERCNLALNAKQFEAREYLTWPHTPAH